MDARVELPPADRTVGQLVAETIRLFGGRFWPSLALGLVVATFDQLALGQGGTVQATLLVLASPFFTLAYIGACAIASGRLRPNSVSSSSLKYWPQPTATAATETPYSRIRSHPMIQATISPSVA